MTAMPKTPSDHHHAADPPLERRDFLRRISLFCIGCAAASLGLAGLRLAAPLPPADATTRPLGALSDFPRHTTTYLPRHRLFLVHHQAGFYALSARCTHLGCLLRLNPNGTLNCPCHGAAFDPNGRITRGPATQPLARYEVHINHDATLVIANNPSSAAAAPEE